MSNPFKALQTRLNLSDNQAAAYLGVPVFTFKKWSEGRRKPSAAVSRLLEVLGTLEAMNPALHAYFLPPADVVKKQRSRRVIQKTKID
jgi:hypothetical protein